MRTLAILLSFLFVGSAFSQARKPKQPQYKKNNRDAVTSFAVDRPKAARTFFEGYLEKHPKDLESRYALALIDAKEEREGQAIDHLKAALDGGLPAARFIAGPRTLNQALLDLPQAKALLADVQLVHGPLLGDPRPDGGRVWVRTRDASEVVVEVGGKRFAAKSSAERDFTAVVVVDGLEPGQRYDYTVSIDGTAIPSTRHGGFSFRTTSEKPDRLSIAFGGGAGYTPWLEHMWDTIDAERPDAMLLLGDNVYIDTPEVLEAQQYCYYRRQSQPEWSRLVARTPVLAVWDDHDFGDNDCHGGPAIEEPAWKRPVWDTFRHNWPNPSFGGGVKQPGVWFAHRMGPVEFFFLDTRYYREKPTNKDVSMLGPVQLAWLKQAMSASDATFKVICSSVPMAQGTKPGSRDTWDGHATEREAIFGHIQDEKIEGVFILAADRHRSDHWRIARPGGYELHEFMSSKLTNIHTHTVMPNSVFGFNKACSFGMVRFDFTGDDPTATYEIRDIQGRLLYAYTLARSGLR